MAIQFNPNALSRFANVDFGNDNAIANLGDNDGLVQKKELGSIFLKPFRLPSTKDRNNAVRTELLKALGQAFDIDGVTERGGKTRFSAEFMDRLEKLLGPEAFKRGDFGIKNGAVDSGKPLSQRRITAIVNAAREKTAMEAVNFTGKMSKFVAETVLKGSGIPEAQDPAQELKRRMNAIAKANAQTNIANQVGVFLRSDVGNVKLDHFNFDRKGTAFEKDLDRKTNVRINGGPLLASVGFKTARDEIVQFVTNNPKATYADADDATKIKAHVLMASANQSIAACVMNGVGFAFDPQAMKSRLSGYAAMKQTFEINLTKNENGDFVISCDIRQKPANFYITDAKGRSEMKCSDVGGSSRYHLDVTIKSDSLEKFVNAKWDEFDYGPVAEAEESQNLPHHHEVAAERLQGDFRLDIDVDVTYQMHADKFFELNEPIVEAGKRADHNVAIVSNLFDSKFNDLPDDILDALDNMKNTINERYGAGTVETREDVLQFVGADAVRNALDGMSVGLPRSLDGDDLRTVMEDLLKAKGLA